MKATENNVGCIKAANEVLGDKWTPQLLRYLANESPVRFCQLQNLVGDINPRTLSARLTQLEAHGIISKELLMNSRYVYCLTKKGSDLLPVLQSMQQWSAKYA